MTADTSARALLEAERQEALDRLAALERDHVGIIEAAGSANHDDEHDPEGATIAFEREQVAALLDQTRAHLDRGRRCAQPPQRRPVRPVRALR